MVMKCKFCGLELAESDNICPSCGRKSKKDKFPVWAIVLIVLSGCGCFTLPVIGIVAAMTIPALVMNTEAAKNKVVLKKTYSSLQQAYLMENAISGRYYSNPDEVWEKSIKLRVNYTDIDGGINLADGTEIKFEKLKNKCDMAPADYAYYGKDTACARLVIDANGFEKSPNRMTTSMNNKKKQTDQFELWMYSNKAVAGNGSFERYLLNTK
jgi:hypothetical protein